MADRPGAVADGRVRAMIRRAWVAGGRGACAVQCGFLLYSAEVTLSARREFVGGGEDTKGREEKEKQREDERDNDRKKRIKRMGKLG